jgi:hypothetical protein
VKTRSNLAKSPKEGSKRTFFAIAAAADDDDTCFFGELG